MRKYVAALAACVMLAAVLTGCRSGDDLPVETQLPTQAEAGQQTEGTDGPDAPDTLQQTEATEGEKSTEATEVTEATEATEAATVQTEPATEPSEEATEAPTEVPTEPNDGRIRVYTKYGTLYYQDQWADFMQTEQTQEGENLIVSFVAEFEGVRYPLFHLTIGKLDEDPIGQITDAQGVKRDVFVIMEEIEELSQLTEGEQNRLFAMQEEINFIIDNLE